MGRSLPVECQHGTIIDYGDFGPCSGGECPVPDDQPCRECWPECEQCTAERLSQALRFRRIATTMRSVAERLHRSGDNDDAIAATEAAYWLEREADR